MKIRVPENYFVPESIVDGSGIRSVIFTQGCTHHCVGCHNQSTWDVNGGKVIDTMQIMSAIEKADTFLHKGITISGGEPFLQVKPLTEIAMLYKRTYNKTIWCYTGFTYDMLLGKDANKEFLKYIDVLVDGKFIQEQKSLGLKFKGSSNQRIIDVQKSLAEHNVVLLDF